MSALILINRALRERTYPQADGGNLRLVFNHPPSPELLDALKASKPQVLAELNRLQQQWLERVARIIGKPSGWLLEHQVIDPIDMQELWHTEPRRAARAAITGLQWHKAKYLR